MEIWISIINFDYHSNLNVPLLNTFLSQPHYPNLPSGLTNGHTTATGGKQLLNQNTKSSQVHTQILIMILQWFGSDAMFTIDAPGWTFNPPSNQDINSAMMTHFTVRPATRHKNQVHACAWSLMIVYSCQLKFSDTVDQLIHSLSVQNYPQIIKGMMKCTLTGN